MMDGLGFGPSNANWVCFDCRTAMRRGSWAHPVKCSRCGKDALCVGWRIAVPPRQDLKAWKQLRVGVMRGRLASVEQRAIHSARQHHYLEKLILKLELKPTHEGRALAIARYRKQMQKT